MIHRALGFPPRPTVPSGRPSPEMEPHYRKTVDWLDATDAHLGKLEIGQRRTLPVAAGVGLTGVALAASGVAFTGGLVLAGLGLAGVAASLALRAFNQREKDFSRQRRVALQAVLDISAPMVRKEVERYFQVSRSAVEEQAGFLRLPGVSLRKRAISATA